MTLRLQQEMEQLNRSVLTLAGMVERQIRQAIKSFDARDEEMAIEVRNMDNEINLYKIKMEEKCLQILALYQPVAINLRKTIAILKVASHLGEMDNLAVNIAKRTLRCIAAPNITALTVITSEISKCVQEQIQAVLNAWMLLDSQRAKMVTTKDKQIDTLQLLFFKQIEMQIQNEPTLTHSFLAYLGVIRSLERIGDAVVRIAENIVYLVDGNLVPHNSSTLPSG